MLTVIENTRDLDTSVMYYTSDDLAKFYEVSRTTIQHWISDGDLDAIKYKQRLYIHPDEKERLDKLMTCGILNRRSKEKKK